MSDHAMGHGRPDFDPKGRLVVRREPFCLNGKDYKVGAEAPSSSLTERQIAVLWEQGWIDTHPPGKRDAKKTAG